MEPADAKDMIEEALERAEERAISRRNLIRLPKNDFVTGYPILLGDWLLHAQSCTWQAQRESLLKGREASDTFTHMQAKIAREIMLKTAAAGSAARDADRQSWYDEALRLRASDAAGHGIEQLQKQGEPEREEGTGAATGEAYEFGEAAFQVSSVMLSIALVARFGLIAGVAGLFAVSGLLIALATYWGVSVI